MEPPGTAPGSEPSITGAFIAIVRVAPDSVNIGGPRLACKRGHDMSCLSLAKGKGAPEGAPLSVLVLQDQKPALMFSNSWIIFARNSDVTGVCASKVVVTGST